MKLHPSECALIPEPGAWRAKNVSTEGHPLPFTSWAVFGKSGALASDQWERSWRTRVRQFGP